MLKTRQLPIVLAGFLLSACVALPSSKTYTPVLARIVNQAQYTADLTECHWTADNYNPAVNLSVIAQGAATGGSNNTAYAVVNPLVPVAGAAGGAFSAALGQYGLTGQDSIKILVRCVAKLSGQDGSAVVADPNE
jgi:hypothetical protein